MKKSDINQPPCYFDKYINLVTDEEIFDGFRHSIESLNCLDIAGLDKLGDAVYSTGKWTIRQMFQHLADSERVLSYRALRIGRGDQTELPGFDEQLFAESVNVNDRSLSDIVEELKIVRTATMSLFKTFDKDAAQRHLTISGNQMSALAYGFAILGHQIHHANIIEEKYLPLVD